MIKGYVLRLSFLLCQKDWEILAQWQKWWYNTPNYIGNVCARR